MPIPSDIANLALWYQPDANVYSDAGVTPAGDGDGVQQINDQSGSGFNATQATAGNRPILKTGIINGRSVLRFAAASSQYLNIGRGFPSDYTAFFLAKRVDNAAHQGMLGNGSDNLVLQRNVASKTLGIWDSTNSWREAGVAIATAGFDVICVRRSQTHKTVRFYRNNSFVSELTWTGGLPGSSSLWFGRTNGGGEYLNCDLGEVFLYSALLTDEQISDLSTYLGVTQYALWADTDGLARMSQVLVEAAHTPSPNARLSQVVVEAAHMPSPMARMSQVVIEVARDLEGSSAPVDTESYGLPIFIGL